MPRDRGVQTAETEAVKAPVRRKTKTLTFSQRVERDAKKMIKKLDLPINPYPSIDEFWDDQFSWIRTITQASVRVWHRLYGPICTDQEQANLVLTHHITARAIQALSHARCDHIESIYIPYHEFCNQMGITPMVNRMITFLFYSHLLGRKVTGANLLNAVTTSLEEVVELHREIEIQTDLLSHIIELEGADHPLSASCNISLEAEFRITILSPLIPIPEIIKENATKYLVRLTVDCEEAAKLEESHFGLDEAPLWQVIEADRGIEDLILCEKDEQKVKEIIQYLDPEIQETLKKWGQLKEANGTVLLYGKSGVGKSVLARAVAHLQKAKLFKVDSSALIIKWVGETEKATRRLFQTYNREVKRAKEENKPIPVLWLDEADQLFSRRVPVMQSTDASHNRTQNIILDEMTDFHGILVATTNKLEDFDPAYARRFKFKVEIQIPDLNTRKRIWQHYLKPELPVEDGIDLDHLAGHFMTGAQIEDIVKRAALQAASSRRDKVAISDLLSAIEHETKHPNGVKAPKSIGFGT